jgi:hypothetical protein
MLRILAFTHWSGCQAAESEPQTLARAFTISCIPTLRALWSAIRAGTLCSLRDCRILSRCAEL